jgi:uncharacterized protein (DUF2147 family)
MIRSLFLPVALLLFVAFWLYQPPALAQNPNPDALLGTWLSEDGTTTIEFAKQHNKYFGTVQVLTEEDRKKYKSRTDWVLYKNFVFVKGRYQQGTVTDPDTDKSYDAVIELVEGNKKAKFKAFWGLLSFKETWTRKN